MAHPYASPAAAHEVYVVLLANRPPEKLLAQFPDLSVGATGVQTALRRCLSEPSQLDALLEKLCSLGVRLAEVHRGPVVSGGERTYEVRVEGEVGEPLLRHLAWPHRVVLGQTRVRIASGAGELHHFLQACTECGANIQRIHRLDQAVQPRPVRAHGVDGGVSRAQDFARGVRHRPGG